MKEARQEPWAPEENVTSPWGALSLVASHDCVDFREPSCSDCWSGSAARPADPSLPAEARGSQGARLARLQAPGGSGAAMGRRRSGR